MKLRTKDQDLVVAPVETETPVFDRYAPVQAFDRYAPIQVDRYAPTQVDRYAARAMAHAILDNLEAQLIEQETMDRYAADPYQRVIVPRNTIIRRTIVIPVRSNKPRGQMLWLPALDYQEKFKWKFDEDAVWALGEVVDFTAASESGTLSPDDENFEHIYCYGIPIEDITGTYEYGPTRLETYESDLWMHVMRLARALRSELAADIDRLLESLEDIHLEMIGWWAGTERNPTRGEVKLAAGVSKTDGLGAAALDYALWRLPEMYGRLGIEVAEGIEAIQQQEAVFLRPREALVLDSADLHRDTGTAPPPPWRDGQPLHELYGQYAVHKVSYHSDPRFFIVAGWRAAHLTPVGNPRKPNFND